MKKLLKTTVVAAFIIGFGATGAWATPVLYDWSYNINGVLSEISLGDSVPAEVDESGFDVWTGLGEITFTTSTVGDNSFLAFFDHEIEQVINTNFDETGSVTGAPAADQSWEIDEPGWFNGDIYENFTAGILDNGIGTSIHGDTTFPEDVSMAMGWDFTLAADETAVITLSLSETMPTSGFYLTHSDPGFSDVGLLPSSFYFSSNLTITGGEQPIPEPGFLLLMATGMAGLCAAARKKKKLNKP